VHDKKLSLKKIKTCFYPQIEGIIDMTNKLVFVTSLLVSCNIFPSLLVSCNLIACVSQHLSVPFYKSMPLSNSSFFLLLLFITTEYFPLFLRWSQKLQMRMSFSTSVEWCNNFCIVLSSFFVQKEIFFFHRALAVAFFLSCANDSDVRYAVDVSVAIWG